MPGYATRVALRELGRRARFLDAQIEQLDELIVPLVTARAPGLLRLHGVGPDTAALLLIAAGDHPQRLRSEAAWAHLCGAAPIPASSGKVTRWRLNRGGDREANHALWRIVITRMSSHPATRAYVARRSKEGLSKKEVIRCLSVTWPARSTPTCARPANAALPGGGLTLYSAAASAGLRSIRRPPPGPLTPISMQLIRPHPWPIPDSCLADLPRSAGRPMQGRLRSLSRSHCHDVADRYAMGRSATASAARKQPGSHPPCLIAVALGREI